MSQQEGTKVVCTLHRHIVLDIAKAMPKSKHILCLCPEHTVVMVEFRLQPSGNKFAISYLHNLKTLMGAVVLDKKHPSIVHQDIQRFFPLVHVIAERLN
jgi:hypothetical protein